MPLISSPIDGSPMRQIQRFGIELDVCPTSGGVWLDKGELEKLITIIKEAAEEENNDSAPPPRREVRYEEPRRYRDDDDDYRKPHYKGHDDHYYKGGYKKKSGLHKVMDIFDF